LATLPLYPPPLIREGEDVKKRGFLPHKNFVFVGTPYSPLLNTPFAPVRFCGGYSDKATNYNLT